MATKIGKIAPIKREYPSDSFKTFETSLAANGFATAPGTFKGILPKKEPSGKFRTGLDPDAGYLWNLSKEDREAEIKRIEEDLEFIKRATNGLDVSPTADYYKFGSSAPVKVQMVKMSNEEKAFNLGDPFELITWRWLSVHPDVAPSLEASRREEHRQARYYIADDAMEQRIAYSKKKAINSAKADLEKLTPTKRKQIARLMGLPVSEDSTEEMVYNEIDTALQEGELKTKDLKGLSSLTLFTELVRMKDDRLKIKDLVEQALQHSVYRVHLGQYIYEGNNKVAESKQHLVDLLLDEKNQDILFALQKKLKEKKVLAD